VDSQDNNGVAADFDYEAIEGVLADADCDASAAEIQAFFCGMLAGGLKSQDKSWRTALVDMVNEGQSFSDEAWDLLTLLFQWTAGQMAEHDSLAPVLLPDDSYPAIDQLEGLVDWSQGFLLGFGLQTGNQSIDNSEVKESLTDLAEICRLELEAEENEETQEALMTLVEHVKVAVQIIHWEMVAKNTHTSAAQTADSPTLH